MGIETKKLKTGELIENNDLLIYRDPKASIKSVGDNKLEGYAVIFTDKDDPDLTGEYFTAECDFNLDVNSKSALYYDHGQNSTVGLKKIGTVEFTKDEAGIFFKAELEKAKEYKEFVDGIMDMAKKGFMGNSSATASHLVDKTKTGKSTRINTWPLIELSLTPTPAEPDTRGLITVKSWNENRKDEVIETATKSLTDLIKERMSIWDLTDLIYVQWYRCRSKFDAARTLGISVDVAPSWEAFINEFSPLAIEVGNKNFGGADNSAKSTDITSPADVQFSVHSKATLGVVEEFVTRANEIADMRETEGKKLFNAERQTDFKSIAESLIAAGNRLNELASKSVETKLETEQIPAPDAEEVQKRMNALRLKMLMED